MRPGAKEFIARVAQDWELVIFSSRKKETVSRLVDVLDPLKAHIKFVLCRNNCNVTQHKRCVKDLTTVQNSDKDSSLILDYKPQNVAFSLDNAVIIMHWNAAEDDNELMDGLAPYFEVLAKQEAPARYHRDQARYQYFLANIYKPTFKAN